MIWLVPKTRPTKVRPTRVGPTKVKPMKARPKLRISLSLGVH